jgi:cytidylate kinase
MSYIPFFQEKFTELKKKYPDHKPIVIVDGLSGVGKNTVAKVFQEELEKRGIKLSIKDASEFFRPVAKEMGYENLDEFAEARRKDLELAKKVDVKLDTDMLEHGLKNGGIITGRIMIGVFGDEADIKVFVTADADKIAERISKDKERKDFGKPVEEIKKRIVNRDKSDIATYEKLYNIDYKEVEIPNALIIKNDKDVNEIRRQVSIIVNLVEGIL